MAVIALAEDRGRSSAHQPVIPGWPRSRTRPARPPQSSGPDLPRWGLVSPHVPARGSFFKGRTPIREVCSGRAESPQRQGRISPAGASFPRICMRGARFSKARAPIQEVCSHHEDGGSASFSTPAGSVNREPRAGEASQRGSQHSPVGSLGARFPIGFWSLNGRDCAR